MTLEERIADLEAQLEHERVVNQELRQKNDRLTSRSLAMEETLAAQTDARIAAEAELDAIRELCEDQVGSHELTTCELVVHALQGICTACKGARYLEGATSDTRVPEWTPCFACNPKDGMASYPENPAMAQGYRDGLRAALDILGSSSSTTCTVCLRAKAQLEALASGTLVEVSTIERAYAQGVQVGLEKGARGQATVFVPHEVRAALSDATTWGRVGGAEAAVTTLLGWVQALDGTPATPCVPLEEVAESYIRGVTAGREEGWWRALHAARATHYDIELVYPEWAAPVSPLKKLAETLNCAPTAEAVAARVDELVGDLRVTNAGLMRRIAQIEEVLRTP